MDTLLEYNIAKPTEYRFLLKRLCGSNSLFDFTCGDLSRLSQKSPEFDFQSQFFMLKISLIIS